MSTTRGTNIITKTEKYDVNKMEDYDAAGLAVWLSDNDFQDALLLLSKTNGRDLLKASRDELSFLLKEDRQLALRLHTRLHESHITSLPYGLSAQNLLDLTESERVRFEFKTSWNPGPVGKGIIHSICAFGNDLYNNNGGYVFIGVACDDETGLPIRPVSGISKANADKYSQELMAKCNIIQSQTSQPYRPLISVETVDTDKFVLVVWCPPNESRPLTCPEGIGKDEKTQRKIYVRGANGTQEASKQQEDALRQWNSIPFDSQRAHDPAVGISALSVNLLDNYLRIINSKLLQDRNLNNKLIHCNFAKGSVQNAREIVPTNLGLLFLTDNPSKYLHSAKIELTVYAADGSTLRNHTITGPLNKQITEAVDQVIQIKRGSGDPLPKLAVTEAIANAIFHRSYEAVNCQPTTIFVWPDRVEINSYPGPHISLTQRHFETGDIPPVPSRNQYIGEVLRGFRLAEARRTGVKNIQRQMKNYGERPQFKFDNECSFFQVVLPSSFSIKMKEKIESLENTDAGINELKQILENESLAQGKDGPNNNTLLFIYKTLPNPKMLETLYPKEIADALRVDEQFQALYAEATAHHARAEHLEEHQCYLRMAKEHEHVLYADAPKMFEFARSKTALTYDLSHGLEKTRLLKEAMDLVERIEGFNLEEQLAKEVAKYKDKVHKYMAGRVPPTASTSSTENNTNKYIPPARRMDANSAGTMMPPTEQKLYKKPSAGDKQSGKSAPSDRPDWRVSQQQGTQATQTGASSKDSGWTTVRGRGPKKFTKR